MKGSLFLSLAALVLFVPAVTGNHHLSFAINRTQVDITRSGCGTDKVCLETPDNCDPAVNASMCLFMSSDLVVSSSTNESVLSFELRGYSEGYIAMGLTMNVSQGMAMLFVCAQNSLNNGSFFFRTARRNNSFPDMAPMLTQRNVTDIRGVVNGNIIRCEFNVPDLNFANINYTVLLGSGNVTNGSLDTFNVRLTRGPLNLTDPTSDSSNPTSPPPTTTPAAPPTLLTITRSGCGTDKLCLETPGNCDPVGNGMCLFTSIVVNTTMPPNGVDLCIELRGDSDGFIALALISTASPETAMIFVCAQDNGRFFFTTLLGNTSNLNAPLQQVNRTVKNVQGDVRSGVIRCVFKIPNVNSSQPTQRNAASTFGVILASGSVNGSTFGNLNVALRRTSLNLADPTLGSDNSTATTPAPGNVTTQGSPSTTCGAVAFHPHALLLLGVLALSIILRN